MLQGRLIVSVDGKDVVLDEGDAVHFDSSAAHSYRPDHQHQGASTAIVVVMPEPLLADITYIPIPKGAVANVRRADGSNKQFKLAANALIIASSKV